MADQQHQILIIDDEPDIRRILSKIFKVENFLVTTAENGADGIKKFQEKDISAIILDMRLPDMHGLEVLGKLKKIDEYIPVIVLTAYGEVSQAVRAIKMGAFDYLTKPVSNKKLILTVNHAIETFTLKHQIEILKYQTGKQKEEIIKGNDKKIAEIYKYLKKISPTDLTIILEGETGVGKEVFANLIHNNSRRKNKQFIKVDLGTIPEALIESELFGYKRGAFTDAEKDKLGRIELAKGGTLFIDEITNIPYSLQGKLLEVLEQGGFFKLGASKKTFVDFRLIVASNISLETQIQSGKFREDLYHRINQFKITIPPLRERKCDIPLFLDFFLKQSNKEFGKKISGFSKQAMDILLSYNWPGNIRELKNTIRQAVLLAEKEITLDCLPNTIISAKSNMRKKPKTIAEIEKTTIQNLLKKYNGNKKKVAEELNIARKTLYNKIRKYEING